MAITAPVTFLRATAPFAVVMVESGIPSAVETWAWDLAHPVGRCAAFDALTLSVLWYADGIYHIAENFHGGKFLQKS